MAAGISSTSAKLLVSRSILLASTTLAALLMLSPGGAEAQTFTGSQETSGPFAGGSQNFWDNSKFNADAAGAASGGQQNLNDSSVLNASVAGALGGGRQVFYDDATLNVTASNALSGGIQQFHDNSVFNALAADSLTAASFPDFFDDSVLKASVGNAITGGSQFFYDSSSLEASATNALNGGEQYFNNSTKLDASAANAVSGGMQFFNDDSVLDARAANAVSGGVQIFSGDSTLNASAANAVSGGMQAFQGTSTLNATATGALGDIVVMLAGSADVQIGATNALSNETEIQFGSTGSALVLNGYSTKVGKLSNMFSGTGTIRNGGEDSATLTVDTSELGDSLFKGVIEDGGDGTLALTKEGAGKLTLTGTSTFTGATKVTEGTLAVDGSIAGSAVTIEDGATLMGKGTVGATTLNSGAAIRAGGPATTLTVNGDLTFNSGARYEVEADPASTASGLIHVTGTATLSGGSVVHVGANGSYKPFSTYTILTADGGLDGTFGGVTSDFAFLTPDLLYVGNDVQLTLLRNDIDFADKAASRNQIATANGAESLGFGHELYDAILLLADAGAPAAFDQLSGEIHVSAKTMLFEDSRFLRQAVLDRLRSLKGDHATDIAAMTAEGRIAPVADLSVARPSSGFWMSGFGSWGDWDDNGNGASLDRSVAGSFVGADTQLGDWRLGLLGGYSQTSFDTNARNSSGNADGYHIGLFGGTRWQGFAFQAGGSYSWNDIETRRRITNPVDQDLKADYGAGAAQVFGEIAYDAELGGVMFTPFVQAAYVNLHTGSIQETGGSAALSADSESTDNFTTTLGLRPEVRFALGDMAARAEGLIGWQHAFGDIASESRLAFAGGDDFTIRGVPMARDSVLLEAGLDLALTGSMNFGAAYQGRFGDGVADNGFTARLGIAF
ncbi:MAG: autotransporter outer membrane beta-barrel domain-containing protein [Pseudomonadota bacterium]